jgi:tRNA(Ile)-lysidine synthase TilS/MesJ
VIRPLAYVRERDLARYAAARAFPLIPCTLCGSQENLQRRQVGAMLRDWESATPGRLESIFHALANVVPTHLLDRGCTTSAPSRRRIARAGRRPRVRRRAAAAAALARSRARSPARLHVR